jgi:hypothetical protein
VATLEERKKRRRRGEERRQPKEIRKQRKGNKEDRYRYEKEEGISHESKEKRV